MAHTDIPHESAADNVHLGTPGWNIRREHAHRFSSEGTHLGRYASLFNAVEINSCYYRPPRFTTYERWAASVPEHFRFAVKPPKVITHEFRVVGVVPALERFLGEVTGLGMKRIYYSAYRAEWLAPISRTIAEKAARGISTLCIFDNTALGAATADALTVKSHLMDRQRVTK